MDKKLTAYEWLSNASCWYDYCMPNQDGADFYHMASAVEDYLYSYKYKRMKYDIDFKLDDKALYLKVKNNIYKNKNIIYNLKFPHQSITTLCINSKDGLKLFYDLANYIPYYFMANDDFGACNGDIYFTDIFLYKDNFNNSKIDDLYKLINPTLVIVYKARYDKKLDDALIDLKNRVKNVKIILITNSLSYELSNIGNTRCTLLKVTDKNKNKSADTNEYSVYEISK